MGHRPLSQLVHPRTPEEFFETCWDHGVHTGQFLDVSQLDTLFSLQQAETLLHVSRFRPNELRLIGDQGDLPASRYLRDDSSVIVNQLFEDHQGGATVLIGGLQSRVPHLTVFARELERDLGHPVSINAYLTPPRAQGFRAHFDTHDVFILQLAGTKHWRLYDPPIEVPLVDQYYAIDSEQLGSPRQELSLAPSTVLYLPRGIVHEARTEAPLSLHLTIGVQIVRWVDVLMDACREQAMRDVTWRRAVPTELLKASSAAPVPCLTLPMQESVDLVSAARRLAARMLTEQRPPVAHRWNDLTHQDTVSLDTEVAITPGMMLQLANQGAELLISFPGGCLRLPGKTCDAIVFAQQTRSFAIRRIPGLTPESRLTLARRLLREGVLCLCDIPRADQPTEP